MKVKAGSKKRRVPQRKRAVKADDRELLRIRSGYVVVSSLKIKPISYSLSGNTTLPYLNGRINRTGIKDTSIGFPMCTKQNSSKTKICSSKAQLNAKLLETSFVSFFKEKWKNDKPFSSTSAVFLTFPFKLGTLPHLISNSNYLKTMMTELLSLPFQRLVNDLYSIEQTSDLFELNAQCPALSLFLELLKGPLLSWMREVTGKKLSGKITATGSKYCHTDRLLCHDDNLSDRSIAFILYLNDNWNESDGGALQLFECDDNDQPQKIVRSVYPSFGSFAFFEVTSRSYHQVQEVLSQNKVRLSINGWFHGDDLPVKTEIGCKPIKFKIPISPKGCSFERWLRPCWLDQKNHIDIKEKFCKQLSISLPKFLRENVFGDLGNALLDSNITWRKRGPAHLKNYEVAKLSTLPQTFSNFLKLLKSKYMFYFLTEVTVDIDPDSKITPVCHIEVQRWSPGDYTLLVDHDPSSDITGIDVHLYFNIKRDHKGDSGTVHYLGPDKNREGFLEDNAQFSPKENTLFLIAHIAGMKRVTKYINHHQNLHFHKIIATYSQG